MYCKNCGAQIDDVAAFCPNCGTATGTQSAAGNADPAQTGNYDPNAQYYDPNAQYQANPNDPQYGYQNSNNGYQQNYNGYQQQNNNGYYNNNYGVAPDDAPNPGFSVLCAFFPVIGLILYLVWKAQYPQKAKSCGIGAIIGVCVSVGISILTMIFGFSIAACAANDFYGMLLQGLTSIL